MSALLTPVVKHTETELAYIDTQNVLRAYSFSDLSRDPNSKPRETIHKAKRFTFDRQGRLLVLLNRGSNLIVDACGAARHTVAMDGEWMEACTWHTIIVVANGYVVNCRIDSELLSKFLYLDSQFQKISETQIESSGNYSSP